MCNIYIDTEDYQKAYETYEKMENYYKDGDKRLSYVYRGKGIILFFQGKYLEAREFYQKSLDLNLEKNEVYDIAIDYGNIAETYEKLGDNKNALKFYFIALDLEKELNYTSGIIFLYYGIGRTYQAMGELKKTHEYLQKSLDLAIKTQEIREKPRIYQLISEAYAAEENYEQAYFYHIKYSDNKEYIYGIEKSRINAETAKKYKIEATVNENHILKQKNLLAENKSIHDKKIRFFLIIGVVLLLFIGVFTIYMGFKRKKSHNELSIIHKKVKDKNQQIENASEILKLLNSDLTEKNTLLEDAQNSINQSIEYASYIQTALLSDKKILNNIFPENFIFYKPKDVVSGDFYYFEIIDNNIIIAVGDCTGHGVPGGFMTMLALSVLDEITRRAEITSTADALEVIRI